MPVQLPIDHSAPKEKKGCKIEQFVYFSAFLDNCHLYHQSELWFFLRYESLKPKVDTEKLLNPSFFTALTFSQLHRPHRHLHSHPCLDIKIIKNLWPFQLQHLSFCLLLLVLNLAYVKIVWNMLSSKFYLFSLHKYKYIMPNTKYILFSFNKYKYI